MELCGFTIGASFTSLFLEVRRWTRRKHNISPLIVHRDADPVGGMDTAKDFLSAIGRDVDKRVNVEKWEDLFLMRRNDFKKLGVGVRDRK